LGSIGAGQKPRTCSFAINSASPWPAPSHLRIRGSDRALLVWVTWLWPSLLGATKIVQPEIVLRWHRTGFKAFWRWKSRNRVGHLCVVPTLTFEPLLAFLVLGHGRRQLLWFEVTRHPTAEVPLSLSTGLIGARQSPYLRRCLQVASEGHG
jgi:hypothetical protein